MIDKLYQLINEAAKRLGPNWTIVFANQNLPRPIKPYISLNVLSVEIPDHVYYSDLFTIAPEQHDEIETLARTVSGWRNAQVELQIYDGINSLATVNKLALVLQTESMLETQQLLDVAIGPRLFIGYVPELLNMSQFEGRGIYQFQFYYTEEYTETINEIRSVELHGCYVGGAASPDYYAMFDHKCPDNAVACEEIIPNPEDVDTDWDDGETGWDYKQVTEWDQKIP